MEKYLDSKLLITLVVFVIVLALAWKFLMPASTGSRPYGSLTQAEYDALKEEDKAKFKKSGDYYVAA